MWRIYNGISTRNTNLFISPGEIITYEIINYINLLKDSGAYFTDAQDKKN